MTAKLFPTVALAISAALTLDAQTRRGQQPDRQRPPETFACRSNDLTSYTGTVVRYQRQTGQTTLTIRTDWETTETVTLRHPRSDDPSVFFRIQGRPFTGADWAAIERAKGVLRDGTRAAVWVCKDGKMQVDWLAPKE